MGRSVVHIAHQPGPVCLKGGMSRWLVGGGGDLGAELHQRLHAARGVLLQFDWRIGETAARNTGRPSATAAEGLAGRDGPAPPPVQRGGALLCHNPQALSNVQEEDLSCAARHQPGGKW
jgi:hypothetical protein